jgi:ribosomal protein S12 methylthiotransferase accessory factor
MPNLFARAASALLGDQPEPAANPDARLLLEALGYAGSASAHQSSAETRHRAHLLQAASRFLRVFELAAPDAPGLVGLGAEFDPAIADPMHTGSPAVGVSGIGLSLQEAFQGCIGEGVEYLSQLQTAGDRLQRFDRMDRAGELRAQTREFVTAFSAHGLRSEPELSWCRATRLVDGRDVLLPADIGLRRPPGQREIKPPFPLSIGSAAGTSWDGAALHGLLELIERDAASLWWHGGRRGRSIPPQDEAQVAAQALLSQLRQDAPARRSWLLDITTDIGVPCVAAVSCMADGFGLAVGLAARLTIAAAIRSAILEMCQVELAQRVVEAKCVERGAAALNAQDQVHRRRATLINADRCLLLQPLAEPVEHLAIDAADVNSALRLLVDRLGQFGIEILTRNLTRAQFMIPMARVIAPGLQLEPSEIVTPRLADTIARTGGGAIYTGGVALI